jgi:hypothetical protein
LFLEHPINYVHFEGGFTLGVDGFALRDPVDITFCDPTIFCGKEIFSSLRSLHFDFLQVNQTNWKKFLSTIHLPRLSGMHFDYSYWPALMLDELVNSQLANQLSDLSFSSSYVDDSGTSVFLRASSLKKLETLDLKGNPISDSMKQQLRERFGDRIEL